MECFECQSSFTMVRNLRRHMREVCYGINIPNNYKCDLCKNSYKTKHSLKVHINKVHLKKRVKYGCIICKVKRGDKRNLILHYRKHHNLKNEQRFKEIN